ncbi:hypothetical protein ES702_06153 [subsurface metagenome]
MEAIEEAKTKIQDVEAAMRSRKKELEDLEEKFSVAKLNPHADHRDLVALSNKIRTVKAEVEERLPSMLEDAQEEIRDIKKAKKEAELLRPKQLELEPKLQKSSLELFEILKAALKINDKHRTMLSAYHQMAKKTGISDLKKVSSGFSSIKPLVNTIEKEVTGKSRDFFRWPANFPV